MRVRPRPQRRVRCRLLANNDFGFAEEAATPPSNLVGTLFGNQKEHGDRAQQCGCLDLGKRQHDPCVRQEEHGDRDGPEQPDHQSQGQQQDLDRALIAR